MGSYLSTPPKTWSKITGRVVVITGANRGIGLATAKKVYQLGATVYIGSRTEAKAVEAIEKIRAEVTKSDGRLKWFIADLASVKKAKQSAEAFLAIENQLDILIHNAAIGYENYELNEDGIDATIATNHIGPFVFTKLVLDTMKQTSLRPGSDVRVVVVASKAHTMIGSHSVRFENEAELAAPFPPTDTDSWNNMGSRYARSKIATILFASELQRRLDAEGSNIIVISLHPGLVKTEGAFRSVGAIPFVGPVAEILASILFVDADEGALNSIFAAIDPVVRAEPEKYKGKYLMPVGVITAPSELAQDEALAKKLWGLSQKIVDSKSTV